MQKLKGYFKIIISAVVVLILVVQILIIVKYKQIEEKQYELILKLKDDNKILENKLLVRQNHISTMLESEGLYLDGNLSLISETFDTLLLKDIVKTKQILIFRYTELNCDECVNSLINSIQESINMLKIDQIAFFAYYQEDRNLGTFKRLNQLQNKIYKIENLGINIENLNSPYFFLLNQDYKIEHVLFLIKNILN
jgi:hypothetical protein